MDSAISYFNELSRPSFRELTVLSAGWLEYLEYIVFYSQVTLVTGVTYLIAAPISSLLHLGIHQPTCFKI